MAVLDKIKRAIRGEVKLTTAAREAWRRGFASLDQRKERAKVENYKKQPADVWQRMAAAEASLNSSAKKPLEQPPLWDGHTSERILDALEQSR